MGVKNLHVAFVISLCSLPATPAMAQIGGGSCSASNLNGTYSLTLSGRGISAAGSFTGSLQAEGTATFDGQSNVTLSGTSNSNLASGKPFTYSGTYTLPSNCSGTVTLAQGSTATFALIVYNSGGSFTMTGFDANYVYSASGDNTIPACGTATLSGPYSYDTTGFTLSGTAQNGVADEAGVLQFDGQGNVTAAYTVTSSGASPAALTAKGTYSVTAACMGSATLTDSAGRSNSLNFVVTGAYGQTASLIEANSQFVRTGTAHSAFTNPAESIGNVASYAVNSTPPGSVFVLFGVNTATKPVGATSVPLPTTLLTTTVTVNGENAHLFYADTGQIDAQMPWDIPGNTVASVIVKNGNATSNAAAVYIPATGTPGISVYGNNRAVVVNKDNVTVNGPASPAAVGDEVVVYFTGGGPVQTAATLVSGAAAPLSQLPVTGAHSLTVGGQQAVVDYMGLTPGGIGLYQANFVVPPMASAGAYPVVITIAGQESNAPVMNVSLH
jgi:uncharacterized protein (TIGR03437 family)